MLFNSTIFIFVFLPLSLSACFLLAKVGGPRAAQICLIVMSLLFYTCWNPKYLPLLLVSITVNYTIAVLMARMQDKKQRKYFLYFATLLNLALLGYYKYTGFLVGSVNDLTGVGFAIPAIALPLGISFYTFQQLTLLADIHNEGSARSLRFHHFFLFVIFFPHLIAGPIVHHREMMPQFERADYRFRWLNFAVGGSLFAVGLFKKAVMADGIATYVSPLYAEASAGRQLSLAYAWAAAFGFLLQMYFDFSGYSEMALGIARMIGIKLPINFNSPLKATSITDHWSRWHMTLTRFLREYLHTPLTRWLTRRRKSKGKGGIAGSKATPGAFLSLIALPTLTTMFLAGLWHGAGYQFLVWGLLHGFFISVNQGWRLISPHIWTNRESYGRIMGPVGFVLTLLCVVMAIPFFRADSLSTASNVFGGMLFFHGVELPEIIANRLPALAGALTQVGVVFAPTSLPDLTIIWLWIAALLLIAVVGPNVIEILRDYEPVISLPTTITANSEPGRLRFPTFRFSRSWAFAVGLVLAASLACLPQPTSFIYFNF
jgi:alginate O-acetyltransferase complex protein AlgI